MEPSTPGSGSPSTPETRRLLVVGLVIVSFIAGAVCSMAGMHWVHIPASPAKQAAGSAAR